MRPLWVGGLGLFPCRYPMSCRALTGTGSRSSTQLRKCRTLFVVFVYSCAQYLVRYNCQSGREV